MPSSECCRLPAAAHLQFYLTATPVAPSTAPVRVTPALSAPFYLFTNLSPSTKYTVSVACVKPDGTRVEGLNTEPMTTPALKCAVWAAALAALQCQGLLACV